MNKKLFSLTVLLLVCAATLWAEPVTRMVFFNLKHEAGSPEAEAFFKNALVLKEVPSLSDFEILKVEGKQFDFDYVIRLVFEDQQGVEDYVNHQIHIDYLEEEWKPNVTGGMLIDLLDLLP
jgi:hypothetical protein